MAKRKTRRKKFLNYLKSKYRLVVLNDDTFEEQYSFRLSRINIYAIISSFIIVITILITIVIFFTPVREYIPGYGNVDMRRNLTKLQLRTDSLEHIIAARDLYIDNIRNVIMGNVDTSGKIKEDKQITYDTSAINRIIPEDSLLREEMEREEKISLFVGENQKRSRGEISEFHFFTPLKGFITADFDPDAKHYGVDIVAPENESIKATLDGTVITASWTVETGYVIGIQHENNLLSFYKHNSVLLKKAGNHVKAGDVIAIVGSSGELTTGPHLHFELWYEGNPIDPKEYMVFN